MRRATWRARISKALILFHKKNGYRAQNQRSFNKTARAIWQREVGQIPTGCVIHHADGDYTNQTLSNLRCMTRTEHVALHQTRYFSEEERQEARRQAKQRWNERRLQCAL